MKKIAFILLGLFASSFVFAQSDEDLFSDDDFFGDDTVVEQTEDFSDNALSQGSLFDNGTIKIGGLFNTSLATTTVLYADDSSDFGEHLKNTTLVPTLNAMLSVDARPTQSLRMYAKFGMNYPFKTSATSILDLTGVESATDLITLFLPENMTTTIVDGKIVAGLPVSTSISDWFYLNELFTDFSIKDSVYFRFGLHTVTWGAGYFFSPVSDMINTSSINPEDVDAQVDGSLNLRTQIVFPSSQNCIWLYVIPSSDFSNAENYLRDTAVAGKVDLVFGNWELGLGAFWKYKDAPKAMFTATGSLAKMSLFGEFVYNYGTAAQWAQEKEDKSHVFQATAGCSYYWKTPSITLAAQYYYNGTDYKIESLEDVGYIQDFVYKGHNAALMANFGRIFGTTDVTASVFGMVNFARGDLCDESSPLYAYLNPYNSYFTSGIFSAMLYYNPINELKLGLGPYITLTDWNSKPTVALKLSVTLGGGKF